jgi:hypothetical protein
MARGNQRDKAREKNLKEAAGKVRLPPRFLYRFFALPCIPLLFDIATSAFTNVMLVK